MEVLMMPGLPGSSGCRVTPPSMTKAMRMITKTTIRTCSEKSLQAITSSTLRTGTKSLIRVLSFVSRGNYSNATFPATRCSSASRLSGDFFRPFPPTAKSLVARLMEVDQDQRLTAQEAINHEW